MALMRRDPPLLTRRGPSGRGTGQCCFSFQVAGRSGGIEAAGAGQGWDELGRTGQPWPRTWLWRRLEDVVPVLEGGAEPLDGRV